MLKIKRFYSNRRNKKVLLMCQSVKILIKLMKVLFVKHVDKLKNHNQLSTRKKDHQALHQTKKKTFYKVKLMSSMNFLDRKRKKVSLEVLLKLLLVWPLYIVDSKMAVNILIVNKIHYSQKSNNLRF